MLASRRTSLLAAGAPSPSHAHRLPPAPLLAASFLSSHELTRRHCSALESDVPLSWVVGRRSPALARRSAPASGGGRRRRHCAGGSSRPAAVPPPRLLLLLLRGRRRERLRPARRRGRGRLPACAGECPAAVPAIAPPAAVSPVARCRRHDASAPCSTAAAAAAATRERALLRPLPSRRSRRADARRVGRPRRPSSQSVVIVFAVVVRCQPRAQALRLLLLSLAWAHSLHQELKVLLEQVPSRGERQQRRSTGSASSIGGAGISEEGEPVAPRGALLLHAAAERPATFASSLRRVEASVGLPVRSVETHGRRRSAPAVRTTARSAT